MTRDEAKQTFTIHTNGSDKFIKVDKRTFDKFIDMIYDDFESDVEKISKKEKYSDMFFGGFSPHLVMGYIIEDIKRLSE